MNEEAMARVGPQRPEKNKYSNGVHLNDIPHYYLKLDA